MAGRQWRSRSNGSVTERCTRRRRRGRTLLGSGGVIVACLLVASGCVVNGTWAAMPAGVVPVQGTATAFADVDCVGTDWCMAVGSMGYLPMVQIWDGASWSVVQAPPIAPSTDGAEMVSIECATTSSCVARIDRFPDGADDYEFAVAWDGEHWLDVPPGGVLDGPFPDVAPYSCSSAGSCLLVLQRPRVTVVWDGAQFTSTPYAVSDPSWDVAAVSCPAADDCLALVEGGLVRWDGSSWSAVVAGSEPPPGIVLSEGGFGSSVPFACASTNDCVTQGKAFPGGARVGLHWDGLAWSTDPFPAANALADLSCAGPGACVGVTAGAGSPETVAWNGDTWYAAPAPQAGVDRLSCLPLRCVAVGGSDGSGRPLPATYTWTNS